MVLDHGGDDATIMFGNRAMCNFLRVCWVGEKAHETLSGDFKRWFASENVGLRKAQKTEK